MLRSFVTVTIFKIRGIRSQFYTRKCLRLVYFFPLVFLVKQIGTYNFQYPVAISHYCFHYLEETIQAPASFVSPTSIAI